MATMTLVSLTARETLQTLAFGGNMELIDAMGLGGDRIEGCARQRELIYDQHPEFRAAKAEAFADAYVKLYDDPKNTREMIQQEGERWVNGRLADLGKTATEIVELRIANRGAQAAPTPLQHKR